MRKLLVVVSVLCIGLALGGSQAQASCGVPTALGNLGGSFWQCADARPVAAFAYSLGHASAANTGTLKIYCDAFDPASNCLQDSGVVGDGKISIESDWFTPGIVGCPTDFPDKRIAIVVQASDGTGIIVSINPDPSSGYVVEFAHPWDAAASFFLPLQCGTNNARPQIVGQATAAGGNMSMNLHFNAPHVYTDCDADSDGLGHPAAGVVFGTCDNFVPSVSLGNVYTSVQNCTGRADPSLLTKVCKAGTNLGNVCTADTGCGGVAGACQVLWTNTLVTPDASGNALITVPLPTDPSKCLYVGGLTNIGGLPSSAVTGYVQAAGGPLASPPKAEAVRASAATGKIHVTWTVATDLGLAGFKLQTETKARGIVDVGSMIAAHGAGGYSADIKTGDLQGGKKVRVVSVLTDGSTIAADWVSF